MIASSFTEMRKFVQFEKYNGGWSMGPNMMKKLEYGLKVDRCKDIKIDESHQHDLILINISDCS